MSVLIKSRLENTTAFPTIVNECGKWNRELKEFKPETLTAPIFENEDGIFCSAENDGVFFAEYDGEFREPDYVGKEIEQWSTTFNMNIYPIVEDIDVSTRSFKIDKDLNTGEVEQHQANENSLDFKHQGWNNLSRDKKRKLAKFLQLL